MIRNFNILGSGPRAEVVIDKCQGMIDITVGNSSRYKDEIINEAWIRLEMTSIRDIIKDIENYLSDEPVTGIARKVYQMPPVSGYKNIISFEVSRYTDFELEIIISNQSRLLSGVVNETYVRLHKYDAKEIRDALVELLDT